MPILRKKKKNNFTVIDNEILKNKDLSLKAKGLLCLMLGLPDDWNFSEVGLTELSSDGATSVRSALQEIIEKGYLTRDRIRDKDGTLRDILYTIYEEPILENHILDNEDNKELNNKELNNKNITTTDIYKGNVIGNEDTLYDYLQENGFMLAPIHYEIVSQWEDNDLTRYAIKQAVLNNKYNINYINKILFSYAKNNITSVQQAIEREEEFNNKRDNYYKNKYDIKESRYEREKRLLEEMCKDD